MDRIIANKTFSYEPEPWLLSRIIWKSSVSVSKWLSRVHSLSVGLQNAFKYSMLYSDGIANQTSLVWKPSWVKLLKLHLYNFFFLRLLQVRHHLWILNILLDSLAIRLFSQIYRLWRISKFKGPSFSITTHIQFNQIPLK